MKIDISEYYKEKGYITAYLVENKEPRRICILKDVNGKLTSTSYAKYLYCSHYKVDIDEGYEIDHIDGNRMNDVIDNLQIISKKYNIQKDHQRKEMIICECPICHDYFLFPKRNISSHPNPCCSRKCGGKKSILTYQQKLLNS